MAPIAAEENIFRASAWLGGSFRPTTWHTELFRAHSGQTLTLRLFALCLGRTTDLRGRNEKPPQWRPVCSGGLLYSSPSFFISASAQPLCEVKKNSRHLPPSKRQRLKLGSLTSSRLYLPSVLGDQGDLAQLYAGGAIGHRAHSLDLPFEVGVLHVVFEGGLHPCGAPPKMKALTMGGESGKRQ